MAIEFSISALIPADPQAVYDAWLDSKGHTAMTGAPAEVSGEIGGDFAAWDGYINGKNIALEPGARIVQTWRTSEFTQSDPDSRVEIKLVSEDASTRLTIEHGNLPEHGMQYHQGWQDFYFKPMTAHFST